MNDYDSFIEDTIYCGDRNITDLGGWVPNGSITSYLKFTNFNHSNNNLYCSRIYDRYSVSNENAKLTYKVGFITGPEMYGLKTDARKVGEYYWLLSPTYVGTSASVDGIMPRGDPGGGYIRDANQGVRPAISLIPGIEYSDGDGNMEHPYIVDTNS